MSSRRNDIIQYILFHPLRNGHPTFRLRFDKCDALLKVSTSDAGLKFWSFTNWMDIIIGTAGLEKKGLPRIHEKMEDGILGG